MSYSRPRVVSESACGAGADADAENLDMVRSPLVFFGELIRLLAKGTFVIVGLG